MDMTKKLSRYAGQATGAALAFVAAQAVATTASAETTLESVIAADVVMCGSNGGRAGFSALDSKGEWQGLDVDMCRAIAASVLGDASKIQMVKTSSQTRFTALQTGEIDVLLRNATWTLSRDSKLALDFVAPTFYDGQGFMVSAASGVNAIEELDGATVCLLPGSTSELVAEEVFTGRGLEYTPVVIQSSSELDSAFFNGRCDVNIQSTSGLAAKRATVAENPADWVILDEIVGKDPMGPVVRQDDPQWKDIVAWTAYAMMEAEELGVTSENVTELRDEGNVKYALFLGADGDLGELLGLQNDWVYNVVSQVGNYGEMFERNLGQESPLKLARGLNAQWVDGGLLYAPPFK
ncbi:MULTISPECIES: amino acid ABC transporter substrate-binding protein [Pacificibacter]|uniref:amino acid ABC transporter substrate-binding protein n=1 Tax=Pacificibacter TaxID=1042323 RepID=UPI0020907D40|nr:MULTISPECIES: amino acid ABC transporter substrate-binding protein [Pacificibacter]MDO6616051.1 amino acid ABC transporter substrate-binding protein [Pacificibacter sp. 1_MG-2023]